MSQQQPPLRILVVEDDIINQTMTVRLLKALGHRTDAVYNGCEALMAMTRQAYDVVFMDVQMPHMDGIETTGYIRGQLPDSQQPWIIALTGGTHPDDRARCFAAGMNDYLQKPLEFDSLIGLLDSVNREKYFNL